MNLSARTDRLERLRVKRLCERAAAVFGLDPGEVLAEAESLAPRFERLRRALGSAEGAVRAIMVEDGFDGDAAVAQYKERFDQ